MTNEERLKEIEVVLRNNRPIYIENGLWLIQRVRELEQRTEASDRIMNAIATWLSQEHGDHEGGEPSNCEPCFLLDTLEAFIPIVDTALKGEAVKAE